MSGLILKDILVARKTIRVYALFLVFYLGLSVMGAFALSFVSTFLNLLVMMLPMSAFAYDEAAKWDRYALSMPLGRRAVVGARYLFALMLALFAVMAGTAASVIISMMEKEPLIESLSTVLASVAIGILFAAIILPLCYKFGPERARPYMFVVLFVPIIILFLAYRVGGARIDLSFLDTLPDTVILGGIAMLPVAALLCLGVSYFISCAIMAKKEF